MGEQGQERYRRLSRPARSVGFNLALITPAGAVPVGILHMWLLPGLSETRFSEKHLVGLVPGPPGISHSYQVVAS